MIGQHLRIRKDGRWIHAIDCGDETVLHLGDETPRRVRRAYRPEFVAGAEAVEPVLHRERTFAPKEIVQRAYSRAADPTLATMFSDSESFAEWCATGRLAGPRNFAVEPATPAAPAAAPSPAQPKKVAAARPAAAPRAKAGAKVKVKAGAKAKAKVSAKTGAKRAPSAKGSAGRAKAKAFATRAAPKPAKKGAGRAARKPAARAAAKARRPAKRAKR